jgi:hypothetical protein
MSMRSIGETYKMDNNKEIKMPEFGKAVNVDKINSFSRKQLKALDRLLNGKATKKDYEILTSASC